MKKVDIEMTCKVEIVQSFNLTDEEFAIVQIGNDKQILKILDSKINFDYITEIQDIDIWDFEEMEND